MSFAGQSLKPAEFEARKSSLHAMQAKLMQYDIDHQDISLNNILWNERAKKLMVVDFEGVCFATKKIMKEVKKEKKLQDKSFLKEMSPNKTLGKRKEMKYKVDVVIRPVKLRVQ